VANFTTTIFYQKVAGGNQTNWTGIASASIDGKHSKYTPSSLSTVNDSNNLSAVDTNIANQEGIIAFCDISKTAVRDIFLLQADCYNILGFYKCMNNSIN